MQKDTLESINKIKGKALLQCLPTYIGASEYLRGCASAPLLPVVKFLVKNKFLLYNFDFTEALLSAFFPVNMEFSIKEMVLNIKRIELFLLGLGITSSTRKIWLKAQIFNRDLTYAEKDNLIAFPGGFGTFMYEQAKHVQFWCNGLMDDWFSQGSPLTNVSSFLANNFLNTEFDISTENIGPAYDTDNTHNVVAHDGRWISLKPTLESGEYWLLVAWRKVLHYATLAAPGTTMRLPHVLSLYNAIGDYLSLLSIPKMMLYVKEDNELYELLVKKCQESLYYAGICANGMSRMMIHLAQLWYHQECLGFSINNSSIRHCEQFPPWAIGGCFGYECYEVRDEMFSVWMNYVEVHANEFLLRASLPMTTASPGYSVKGTPSRKVNGGRIWVFVHRDIEVQLGLIGEPNTTFLIHDFMIDRWDPVSVGRTPNPFQPNFDEFGMTSVIYCAPSWCSFMNHNGWVTVDVRGVQRTDERYYHDLAWQSTPCTDFTWASWIIVWLNSYYRGGFNSMGRNVPGLLPRTDYQLSGGYKTVCELQFYLSNCKLSEWKAIMYMFATIAEVACLGVTKMSQEHRHTFIELQNSSCDYLNLLKIEYCMSQMPVSIYNNWLFKFRQVVHGSKNYFDAMNEFWSLDTVRAFRENATLEMRNDTRDINWLTTPTPISRTQSFNF